MRSIAALLARIPLLLLAVVPVGAQHSSVMSDPVFGMEYDTRSVRFESVPGRIADACPRLREERYWLYAYWRDAGAEYLVVSSRSARDSGGGVMMRGSKCILGLPDWLLFGVGTPAGADAGGAVTAGVMKGLAADLFRRYAAAYGGKAAFLRAVANGGLAPSDLPPGFRKEFEAYANLR